MTPWVVGTSQLSCIGPANTCGWLQVCPLLTEDVKPTSSWQVGPLQLASRSK